MRHGLITTLFITAGMLGAAGSAIADRGSASDGRLAAEAGLAPGQALLTPAQAATIAEVKGAGRVVRSRFDAHEGAGVYRFDLVTDGGAIRRVAIAAAGGDLLSVAEQGEQPRR